MADFLLLIEISFDLSLAQHGFFLTVGRIVAGKDSRLPPIQFHDFFNSTIQKVPVVGNDDDAAGIVGQIGFQPGDTFHVQMVGGLV